jgi:hypothetical protein
MEEEKYVSRQGVSRDLLHIVAKFGLAELRQYIKAARNPAEVNSILLQSIEWLENGKFTIVRDYNQSPNIGTMPGYQPFEKAWKQLVAIQDLPANKIKNKYQLVLDSVSFVEADIMRRLIRGDFDVENVKVIYGLDDFATESTETTENKSSNEQLQPAVVEAVPNTANGVGGESTNTETPAVEVDGVTAEETPPVTTKKKRGRKKKAATAE